MAPCTDKSTSASLNTMNGALPPSSIDVRFTVIELAFINFFPMAVEPVKEIFFTKGFETSSSPISSGSPITILRSPLGIPARSPSDTKAIPERGVLSSGLHTTLQPAANAGAIFLASIAKGKFQGVIQATIPTGFLVTNIFLSAVLPGIRSPQMRLASSANHSIYFAP